MKEPHAHKRSKSQKHLRRTVKICRVLLAACFAALLLAGCRKTEESERTEVEFSVMTDKELPQELLGIIEENKENEMRLTWADGEEMYLIRGYGKQSTGGYSIAVAECAEDEETLWFDTRLIGPQDTEGLSGEASCPYLVVKIVSTEKEVVID
ncbi:MAG: protease complex subunit PrcB family protein [Lachnospiraceae bacterium]|nr:protease complex subunit PrcB family protein [Lachnospiraceae bacterium]